jgi:hypothetical protein
MGVGGQRHAPAALPPGKRPGTPCIGGWVGLRAGLDDLVLGSRTIAACCYYCNNPEQLLISQEMFWLMAFVFTEQVSLAVAL